MTVPMRSEDIAARSQAGVAVEVVEETGSTNADLLARAAALDAPLLLVARNQTAGEGIRAIAPSQAKLNWQRG